MTAQSPLCSSFLEVSSSHDCSCVRSYKITVHSSIYSFIRAVATQTELSFPPGATVSFTVETSPKDASITSADSSSLLQRRRRLFRSEEEEPDVLQLLEAREDSMRHSVIMEEGLSDAEDVPRYPGLTVGGDFIDSLQSGEASSLIEVEAESSEHGIVDFDQPLMAAVPGPVFPRFDPRDVEGASPGKLAKSLSKLHVSSAKSARSPVLSESPKRARMSRPAQMLLRSLGGGV